jgi:hypothetical protein
VKLVCYALHPNPPKLVPAPLSREWMNQTSDRYAYRCLPLNIANGYGWEVLSPCAFSVTWSGGPRSEDIVIRPLDGSASVDYFVVSHFNHGIVTFHTGYLFRTEEDWDLMVAGPVNRQKDGIVGLTGIVETDWLPFPFTMNWRFTRPGAVRFDKGEPVCVLFPIRKGTLQATQPEIRDLEENPELVREYEAWKESRTEFISKLRSRDAQTIKQAWQRFYFQGVKPTESAPVQQHTSKLRAAEPSDRRKRKRSV